MGAAYCYVNVLTPLLAYLEELRSPTCTPEDRVELLVLLREPEHLSTYDEYRQSHAHEEMPELAADDLGRINCAVRWISAHRDPEFLDGSGCPHEPMTSGADLLESQIRALVADLEALGEA